MASTDARIVDTEAAGPSFNDYVAAVLSDIEDLARHGHVARAAERAASLPPLGSAPLAPVLARLRGDGYTEEAALVELGWRQPLVLDRVHRAARWGWVAAVVVFLVFVVPARFLAVIPAMGMRLLVSELYVQLAGPRVLKVLAPVDRRRARALWDLNIYSTRGTNRLGEVDAAMLTLGGIVLYGAALWARTNEASPLVTWALTVSGTIMAFAGGFAIAATRRLRRNGIQARRAAQRRPPAPIERPVPVAIEHPIVFRRPRLARSLLVPAFLVIVGVPTIMEATPLWIAVGSLCLLAAVALVRQAIRSVVVIGPEGIRSIGVVHTRTLPWSEIAHVRIVTGHDDDRTQSLHVLTAEGADRTLVANVGRAGSNPELLRLCDSMNEHASAPKPRVTRRAWGTRLAGMVALAFVLVVLGLIIASAVSGDRMARMPIAEVPAGRPHTAYRIGNGSVSQAAITCPSLAEQRTAPVDPLCTRAYEGSAATVAVALVIEACILAGFVLLARSLWNLRRSPPAHTQDREAEGH